MLRRRKIAAGLFMSLVTGLFSLAAPQAPVAAVAGGWEALGSGMPDGTVFQIVSDGAGTLYAGGTFTSVSGVTGTRNIAKWNGAAWSALGGGVTASGPNDAYSGVFAVGIDTVPATDVVYIGGDFSAVDGVAVNRLAKWNGSNWSELGDAGSTKNGVNNPSDVTYDGVEEIVVKSSTEVFVGGRFEHAFDKVTGTISNTAGIAKYDATNDNMVAVGSGIGGDDKIVNGLTLAGTDIVATGQFTKVNGSANDALRVGKWNGSTWSVLGSGTSGPANGVVAAVAADGSDVFVGGNFTKAKDNGSDVANTNGLAMWDDSASKWISIGGIAGTGAVVEELRVIDHFGIKYLYAGGNFTVIGGAVARNIARMNLNTPGVWEPLTYGCIDGVNGAVRSIIDAGAGAVYVGGNFTNAGGVPAADRIAKFTPGGSPGCGAGSIALDTPTDFRIVSAEGARKRVGGTWGQYVTLDWKSSGPLAPVAFKITVDRVEDTVKGEGTSWSVISSHPEFDCWSTELSCTIYMPYSFYGGFGLTEAKFTLSGYSLVGSSSPISIEPPDPDAPPRPAGAPTNVVATAMERLVRVTWAKPADQGTYPIAIYLVMATRVGGRFWDQSCISRYTDAVLESCTFQLLTPGVQYTFRVQGLNGAGWGEWSASSNAASPIALDITKSNRNKRTFLGINLGSTMTVEGTAPGTSPNTAISVWVQWIDASGKPVSNWELQPGIRTNSSGKFSFKGNFPKARNGQRMIVKVQTAGTCFTSGTYEPCVYQSQEVTLRSV